jgi:hypothetical protein
MDKSGANEAGSTSVPSDRRKQRSWVDRATIALAIATVVHGVYFVARRGDGTGFDYADEPTKLGVTVDQVVVDWTKSASARLSDIGAASCRYVIVASSICPFCKEAAVRWTVEGLRGARDLVPEGWSTFWVLVEPEEPAPELADPAFPAARHFAVHNATFMGQVGVTGFPYHLVLDRDGTILAAGTGAELPPLEAFNSACEISGDE